jgi:hypothetical protein
MEVYSGHFVLFKLKGENTTLPLPHNHMHVIMLDYNGHFPVNNIV